MRLKRYATELEISYVRHFRVRDCELLALGFDSTELQSYGKPNSDLGFLLANGPGWGPLAILGYLTALSYLIQIYCYSGANWDPRTVVARPGIA